MLLWPSLHHMIGSSITDPTGGERNLLHVANGTGVEVWCQFPSPEPLLLSLLFTADQRRKHDHEILSRIDQPFQGLLHAG